MGLVSENEQLQDEPFLEDDEEDMDFGEDPIEPVFVEELKEDEYE